MNHDEDTVPDGSACGPTNTYQAFLEFEIKGVGGTAVNSTADKGRFCYAFCPTISYVSKSFSNVVTQTQRASIDGNDVAALWPNRFVATASNPFCTYAQDKYAPSWVTLTDTGDMAKCRPVSMSCLCSYNGNVTGGAGTIAARCFPGGMWQQHFTSPTSGIPKRANWEDLADYQGAYKGPLTQGTYCWWRPDGEVDLLYRPVMDGSGADTMSAHNFPIIVVAGIINDSNVSSLTCSTYINYEYTSDTRTRPGSMHMQDPMVVALVMKTLQTLPTAMPNGDHIDWIKVVLGGVAGFAVGGPVGAALGAAAGAGVSLFGLRK
jgi:hypothetical protein